MDDKKQKPRHCPPLAPFALSGSDIRFGRSNSSIPTEEGVKEAKDWVDHNEK